MSDAIIAPIWLSINMLLGVTAWRWSRRLFPQDPLLEVLAHTIVLCWACIVAVATLLGLVYCLTGLSLLLGVAAVAGTALLIVRRKPNVNLPSLLAVSTADKLWLCLWCVQLGFWIGHVVSNGLWTFPTVWDTLEYHLPLVDHWLQARSLYAPDCGHWTSPGNNELLALWATGPFSGDFLARLSNLPPTILFACSAVIVGSRIGLPGSLAHLGSFALTANYIVFSQLTNNHNDVAVAACFFAAALYMLRFAQGTLRLDLCLAGISIGLLGGIKFYAAGYAILALAALVMSAAMARGHRAACQALLIGTVGLMLWGGYWYARNFVVTGSPLYPREFFTLRDTLTQLHPQVAMTSFFGNRRAELLPLYIDAIWQMSGPCQLCGFLAVPLSLAWLIGAATNWTRLTLAFLVGGTGLLLGMTPFAVENAPGTLNQLRSHITPVRYGICFLSVATMAFLLVLFDLLQRTRSRLDALAPAQRSLSRTRFAYGLIGLLGGVLLVAGLFQLLYVDRRLQVDFWLSCFVGITFFLVIMVGLMIPARWRRARLPLLILSMPGLISASGWAGGSLSQHWHDGFESHYDKMFSMNKLSWLPCNSVKSITFCVLKDRSYPFFGSHREHRVCQPAFALCRAALMEYFRGQHVDLIVHSRHPVQSEKRRFRGIQDCLLQFPALFRQTFENDMVFIHQFLAP